MNKTTQSPYEKIFKDIKQATRKWSDPNNWAQCSSSDCCPLLSRLLCNRLPGNGLRLVFLGSDDLDAILAHQPKWTLFALRLTEAKNAKKLSDLSLSFFN